MVSAEKVKQATSAKNDQRRDKEKAG